MGWTRLAVVVLLAGVAAASAQVADPESTPKPLRSTSCWDCHAIAVGSSPPIAAFANLLPPEQAGSRPGEPFEYAVQVQNAWTADVRSIRLTLDLTAAPSLGFASDVPPLREAIEDAITIQAARAAEPQRQAVTVAVPFGETRMDVRLRPGDGNVVTGPDLRLLVFPPGRPLDGPPETVVDVARRGGDETYTVPDRATFVRLGYGNWTFVAETRLVPDDPTLGPSGPLGAPTRVPFFLDVNATSESTGERVSALGTRDLVRKGGAFTMPFRLVALAAPQPGETVALSADLWVHYRHATDGPDDDENTTLAFPEPIPVVAVGDETVLRPGTVAPPMAPGTVNGATMATASEAVGYASAFLLVSSIASGGLFGKASRRGLNRVFGTAKRRVAFHNFLSYGLVLAAAVHTTLFVVEATYHWTLGLLWGGGAIAAMLGLGVTGALQVPLVRRWGYAGWRWTHYGLALAAIALTVAHGLLDGVHFTDVQDAVGWDDPLAPRATA